MRVLHVASEVSPWSQTGGLADVVGSVPAALAQLGGDQVEIATVTPLYRGVRERVRDRGLEFVDGGVELTTTVSGTTLQGRFRTVHLPDSPPVHFLDCPALYDRFGLYADEHHRDYPDNPLRFAFLCRAALQASPALMTGPPDLVHAHDWQTALIPVYLREWGVGAPAAATVLSIHNLAYQGSFDCELLPQLGLDTALCSADKLEANGQANLLKGGIAYADAITTVSPSYAEEICTAKFGHGLDEFLRTRADGVRGILNGIDTDSWNPRTDPDIAHSYSRHQMLGKAECRIALLDELQLPAEPSDLVVGVVSRFAHQKGLDLVADIVPGLAELGVRLVVLGSGDHKLEHRFSWLAERFADNLALRTEFNVPLSRRIYAGVDALLVPSRFEPCGLSQLYAMRYGTVPIVHSVGGLRDTVNDFVWGQHAGTDHATGFCFEHATADGLWWALERAVRCHRDTPYGWKALATAGMSRDSSWTPSAQLYLRLYRDLVERRSA